MTDHRGVRRPALTIALALALLGPGRADAAEPPLLPRESPRYGEPYRTGLAAEIGVGLSACQPSLLYGGACATRGGRRAAPGLALRLGGGWRFNRNWMIAATWVRQSHRPGGSFSSGSADGALIAGRGIVPLARRGARDSRVDLGFELGLGWSRRALAHEGAPAQLSSTGALVRPAIMLEGWVLADLALGIELASHLNFHWQHCVDAECRATPGAWVASELEQRWVDGFTISVRATGLVFPRL